MNEKLLFKLGSKIDIAGSSGSGKTFWLVNYLTKIDDRFDCVIWITNELSALNSFVIQITQSNRSSIFVK